MSLIVKIMSGEDMADDDSRKSFQLHSGVLSFTCIGAIVSLTFSTGPEMFTPEGNVYVMNEAGKTIASWSPTVVDNKAPVDLYQWNGFPEIGTWVFKYDKPEFCYRVSDLAPGPEEIMANLSRSGVRKDRSSSAPRLTDAEAVVPLSQLHPVENDQYFKNEK